MKKLFINPQKKGGVFKSGITNFFSDYLKNELKMNVKVFDIDNRNSTTARYKSLEAELIDTKHSNNMLDKIFEAFEDFDIVVVDVGAGTAENILDWIKEIDLVEVMKEEKIDLEVIVPITMVKDSVAGLKDIHDVIGNNDNVRYIIILNHYLGDDFSIFENSKTKEKIMESNYILLELPKLNESILQYLDKDNLILSDAIDNEELAILKKQRIKNIQKILWKLFDNIIS